MGALLSKIIKEKNDLWFRVSMYVPIFLEWTLFYKGLAYMSTFEPTLWNCYNFPAFLIYSMVCLWIRKKCVRGTARAQD